MSAAHGGNGLTVYGAAYGVGLGEVADAAEQLGAVTLAVLFNGVDLGHGGSRVGPEDGLAVLPAGGVTPCIATACGTHWEKHTHTQIYTHRLNNCAIT